jgi:hypothetical protein
MHANWKLREYSERDEASREIVQAEY